MDAQSDALIKHTSLILDFVSATPGAIARLHSITTAQAEQQSREVKNLHRGLSTCTKDMLEAIGRNTRMLLNITSQLKRIVRAIETIPLHLTLDIVRLDDALGVSWGLPFQACGTFNSFYNLLRSVIFASGRPGASRVEAAQFIITLSKTGQKVEFWNWENAIKPGIHIEQAMIAEDSYDHQYVVDPVPYLEAAITSGTHNSVNAETWYLLGRAYLRLGAYVKAFEAIQQAIYRDSRVPSIWNTVAILYYSINQFRDCLDALVRSVRLNPYLWAPWYNLSVLYDACDQRMDAIDAFQRCLELNPRLPDVAARFQVLRNHYGPLVCAADNHKIRRMCYIKLCAIRDTREDQGGSEIALNPLKSLDSESTDSNEETGTPRNLSPETWDSELLGEDSEDAGD
ncbi:hypothetical protein DL764_009326 [Monosporascus ibericus]|uniref:Ubiquitin-like domain-containing protein n=1 Tax=Monosporascus ibericus TaxID=155417 RepID=A0A4Q4SYC4_9PEZI|nr:hypothetical protein DL764_009326 [Monosporascus ibericus]